MAYLYTSLNVLENKFIGKDMGINQIDHQNNYGNVIDHKSILLGLEYATFSQSFP